MLTGEVRSQIDAIWNAFWTGGISNPLEVIEQITYLLFLKRLDDLHTLEENKASRLKKPIERRIFPEGADPKGRSYEELRWARFKNYAPAEMFTVVSDHVFPFLRTLGGDDSTYAHHMKDARFTIPTPALLAKVVDMLDHVPMEDRDTKGDLYEYMLGKIATAGQNGQFRTPLRALLQRLVKQSRIASVAHGPSFSSVFTVDSRTPPIRSDVMRRTPPKVRLGTDSRASVFRSSCDPFRRRSPGRRVGSLDRFAWVARVGSFASCCNQSRLGHATLAL